MTLVVSPYHWRTALPILSIVVGGLILFVNPLVSSSTTFSMLIWLFAALSFVGGYCFIHPTPIYLVFPNLVIAVLLFLHAVGLCRSSCGDFQSYQYVGLAPTSAIGAGWHFLVFITGIFFMRRQYVNASLMRFLFGLSQGISLFFAIILVAYGHWCPSCAAAHAFMLGQAVLVWRLTQDPQRLTWLMSIVLGALTMNLVFHHRYEKPAFGPSAELLGYMHALRNENQAIALVVEQKASDPTANTAAKNALDPKASGKKQIDVKSMDILVANTNLRMKNFNLWGSADAPRTVLAHLNLACPACRAHWRELDTIHSIINNREACVRIILSWPISPEPHYGARYATYAAYSVGFLGEEQFLAALDLLFSDDGLFFMNNLNENIREAMVAGKITEQDNAEALISVFKFLNTVVPYSRSIEIYSKQRPLIDGTIQANMNWLVNHGNLATPNYYFTKTDHPDQNILNTSSLDVEVWKAFIKKSSP